MTSVLSTVGYATGAAGQLGPGALRHAVGSVHELTETPALHDVLDCLTASQPRAVLLRGDHPRPWIVQVLGRSPGRGPLRLRATPLPPAGPCVVRVALHGVVFLLQAQLGDAADGPALVGPLRLYCLDRRLVTRQPMAPGRGALSWHALDAEAPRLAHSSVRDFTPDGVGVAVESGVVPPSGTVFPAALRIGDSQVQCLAEVCRPPSEPDGLCGVRLRPAAGRSGLVDAYLAERLPQLVPRHSLALERVTALMVESGYAALRQGAGSLAGWHTYRGPNGCSFDRVYVARDGTPLGHASATRIYRRTWALHQLACRRGHAEDGEARTALYMMMTSVPTLCDGDEASIVAYFDRDKRWHQWLLCGFIDWVGDERLATVAEFDRFEVGGPPHAAAVARGLSERGTQVRPLRQEEMLEAVALIRAQLPAVTANAFDIEPGALEWHDADGDGRGRHALALVLDGHLLGVALCETGRREASLFDILQMAQVYLRVGRGAPEVAAQCGLVEAVRAYYRERGIGEPLLVAPAGTLERSAHPAMRWVEAMGCATFAGKSLKQWENFSRFHLGRRYGGAESAGEKSQ